MSSKTSSATQLVKLLKEAIEIEGTSSPVKNVWMQVLGANQDDFTEKLSLLFELFNDVRTEARSLQDYNHEKYIDSTSRIQSVLMKIMYSKDLWVNVKAGIDYRDVSMIEGCGDVIKSLSKGFVEISQDELSDLKQQIHELIDKISVSEIKQEVKSQIISNLRKIEDAILNYSIRGTAGIAKTSDESFGSILHISHEYPVPGILGDCLELVSSIGAKCRDLHYFFQLAADIGPHMNNVLPHAKEAIQKLLPGSQ
jgi:hypothetical protein